MLIQNTPEESLKKSGQNLRMSTLNANTQIHKYTNALILDHLILLVLSLGPSSDNKFKNEVSHQLKFALISVELSAFTVSSLFDKLTNLTTFRFVKFANLST
jgi:hypothetical protein